MDSMAFSKHMKHREGTAEERTFRSPPCHAAANIVTRFSSFFFFFFFFFYFFFFFFFFSFCPQRRKALRARVSDAGPAAKGHYAEPCAVRPALFALWGLALRRRATSVLSPKVLSPSFSRYTGDDVLANILLRYAIRRDLPLGIVRENTSPKYALWSLRCGTVGGFFFSGSPVASLTRLPHYPLTPAQRPGAEAVHECTRPRTQDSQNWRAHRPVRDSPHALARPPLLLVPLTPHVCPLHCCRSTDAGRSARDANALVDTMPYDVLMLIDPVTRFLRAWEGACETCGQDTAVPSEKRAGLRDALLRPNNSLDSPPRPVQTLASPAASAARASLPFWPSRLFLWRSCPRCMIEHWRRA